MKLDYSKVYMLIAKKIIDEYKKIPTELLMEQNTSETWIRIEERGDYSHL